MTATVHKTERIHSGRVFELNRENVTLPNGLKLEIDLIRHPGASAIVPVTGDRIIMIRQYRHAVGGYIWEIPAGTLDPQEKPLDCARRELQEETGYSAETWEELGEIIPVPGYSDERIHLFMATDLRKNSETDRKLPDADEILDVHVLSIDRIAEMIDAGEIQDAKTLAGVLRFFRRL